MKHLKIEKDFLYFKEQLPSKSFMKKLSVALTAQILCLIDSEDLKNSFTDIIEVAFDNFCRQYNPLRPSELFMKIEAKNSPLGISNIIVFWKPKDYDGEELIYPWSDVSKIDIDFEMKISKDELKRFNYLLPLLYAPIISSADSGLPYDYQIKSQTTDGTLLFYCNDTFEQKDRQELEFKLNDFVKCYNESNEKKVHYIGPIRVLKSNRICVDIDFSSCSKESIKECIYAFKEFSFIKKIVYK